MIISSNKNIHDLQDCRGRGRIFPKTLKFWVGVQQGQSLTSWTECASLALVGHPSSDGVTIKIPYGLHVLLHQRASHPTFPTGLVKTESEFIVRSAETGLGS